MSVKIDDGFVSDLIAWSEQKDRYFVGFEREHKCKEPSSHHPDSCLLQDGSSTGPRCRHKQAYVDPNNESIYPRPHYNLSRPVSRSQAE